MILDLDNQTLSYIINGEAINNVDDEIFKLKKDDKYRMAFSLCPGIVVELK